MAPMQPAVVANAISEYSLRRVDRGAVQLEFQERGSGDPVLLIHAALLADWFTPLLAQVPLTQRCRLISSHRVGFAGSSRATAPLSIVDQARHAREILTELGAAASRCNWRSMHPTSSSLSRSWNRSSLQAPLPRSSCARTSAPRSRATLRETVRALSTCSCAPSADLNTEHSSSGHSAPLPCCRSRRTRTRSFRLRDCQ